jgi:hypothetical protein
MEFYGLQRVSDNRLLSWVSISNEGSTFCENISFELSVPHSNNEPIWMVPTYEMAENVRNLSTPWYNADYNHPSHTFDPQQLRVVRIQISITKIPEANTHLNEDTFTRKEAVKCISNYARSVLGIKYNRIFSNDLQNGFRVKLWIIQKNFNKIERLKAFCLGLGAKEFKLTANRTTHHNGSSLHIYF